MLPRLCAAAILALAAAPSIAQEPAPPSRPAGEANAEPEATVLYKVDPKHSIFDFDYAPPSSPTLNLLGLSPEKAPASTSLKEFVVSVPGLIGSDKDASAALDFTPAALFQAGRIDSYSNYMRGSFLYRLQQRTRMNFGLRTGTEASDPSKSVRSGLAIGLSASLLDSADPLVTHRDAEGRPYILQCLNRFTSIVNAVWSATADVSTRPALRAERVIGALLRADEGLTRGDRHEAVRLVAALSDGQIAAASLTDAQLVQQLDALITDWEAQRDAALIRGSNESTEAINARFKSQLNGAGAAQAFAGCATRASQLARYSADIDIGIGALWNGDPGEVRNFRSGGQVVWAGAKLPLGVSFPDYDPLQPAKPPASASHALMLVAFGRFGFGEQAQSGDTATPFFKANTIDAWAGLEFIRPEFRLTAQYGWVRAEADDTAQDQFSRSGERYLLSSQIRLGGEGSGLWLGASYGDGHGTAANLKATTALVTLSYSPPPPPDIAQGN